MNTEQERIDYLFNRYIQKSCTREELREWLQFHEVPAYTEYIYKKYGDLYSSLAIQDTEVEWETMYATITHPKAAGRISFLNAKPFIKYAAAFILVLAGVGLWVSKKTMQPDTAIQVPVDIPPAGNRATLTLGDGSEVRLDAEKEGKLAHQGAIDIVKLSNGQVVYKVLSADEKRVLLNKESISYNTIFTPRGGQYQVVLSDGTRVWLNAASSIKFPTFFKGGDRTVELSGEAYFDVNPKAALPFVVKTPRGEAIHVLGTQFNVNAYTNEPFMKTSLVEGSVKINQHILKPGEAFSDGKIIATDIEKDIAWKNGFFNFSQTDLPVVLRELSRWYDIDIEYEGKIPDRKFGGKMQRDLNLSQVLAILKRMNINFTLKGKKLLVRS